MSRKIPWPFVVVVITSFLLGAAWGWKLIQDRAAASGRLVSEAKLRILSPPGLFPRELLIEFQRREKIEVEVSVEHFPASLLRRALKSAPGQYDIAITYHYQVSALRAERKLTTPYDSRIKFPIAISPDFRKLPDDRNLMDTTPLLWGLIGIATQKVTPNSKSSFQIATWPSLSIGAAESSETPAAYASKLHSHVTLPEEFEKNLRLGPAGPVAKLNADLVAVPRLISHASLEFSPLKEMAGNLEFQPLADSRVHPLWILTAVTMIDGDLERTRKFLRFLLEPANNVAMVKYAGFGATTLRDGEDMNVLPKPLRSSYFRTFPIDQILLEKDERVRLTDEAFEQLLRGADVKNVVRATPTPRPTPKPVAAPLRKPKPTLITSDDATDGASGIVDGGPPVGSETTSGTKTAPTDVKNTAPPTASTPAHDAPVEVSEP